MRMSRTVWPDDQGHRPLTMARRKQDLILYSTLWTIIGDRHLSSTTKIVATTLLLKFWNKETGRCNPSYRKIADVIGMSRDTVMDAVKELVAADYLTLSGTKGGSARNTNQFEFHMKLTSGALTTGGRYDTGRSVVDRSGGDDTEGVARPPHELSIEPSRTIEADHVEAVGPDRSLRRSLSGARRDPVRREGDEVVQNRIAQRLPGGWDTLGKLSSPDLERLTQSERDGTLTIDELTLAVAASRNS